MVIDWIAQDMDVGVDTAVEIVMASDSRHHRQGFAGDDGLAIVRYTVLPRDGE